MFVNLLLSNIGLEGTNELLHIRLYVSIMNGRGSLSVTPYKKNGSFYWTVLAAVNKQFIDIRFLSCQRERFSLPAQVNQNMIIF